MGQASKISQDILLRNITPSTRQLGEKYVISNALSTQRTLHYLLCVKITKLISFNLVISRAMLDRTRRATSELFFLFSHAVLPAIYSYVFRKPRRECFEERRQGASAVLCAGDIMHPSVSDHYCPRSNDCDAMASFLKTVLKLAHCDTSLVNPALLIPPSHALQPIPYVHPRSVYRD